ncbi:ExbD/TolR family protein [Mucilaginibacter sp. KACC 22063]|uniref:ExbD/TolR family protein n=1 Tax=Mucilaginibacter sp. KACC 22063 TaxID=3025666 RepID=UPI002365EAB9|nr:biopolymer transporter ExbD [Mucilaginibacter sp. KACC 22063]WDF56830.1 biopolymer transporter ExbD [Mucilaginibacter sp. KACC 22063]
MAELNSTPEKAGNKTSRNRLPLRVDLTAMVDLAFLLITFFMLTTTLQKNNAMAVTMPADGPSEPVGMSRTLTLCLGNHNKVLSYMGTPDKPLATPQVADYSKSGIRKLLLETAKNVTASTGKRLVVLVKPSDHSVYENLVSTLDELNITKTESYAIVDITKNDVGLLKQYKAY